MKTELVISFLPLEKTRGILFECRKFVKKMNGKN